VPFYFEAGFQRKSLFQFTEVIAAEIDHSAAVGANQVVMMFGGANSIAMATVAGVELTDKF
jgi:hypothetical protein